jgi:glutamate-1-semialdehyde 2,1-aminomutase
MMARSGLDREQDIAQRALQVMPGGASHDGRQLAPHGLFAEQAEGPWKASVDGRRCIDLQCGNGSLLLGHGHPEVVEAGRAAILAGLNFSAGSEVEVQWAEAVRGLMPCAEQVRFTASGNEACALSFAVARAATGRNAVLTLCDHYSGWVGPALLAKVSARAFLEQATPAGGLTLVEAQDVPEALVALASGRVAGVIFEPTGGSFGKVPLSAAEARALNEAARQSGSLCILDETISGFRVALGGAQQLYGLTPDLIILGKVLGGGLPAGALAGRADIMSVLDNRSGQARGAGGVAHMGTGNGNPVVAAVGLATLRVIASEPAIARANHAATRLRVGFNRVFQERAVGWAAYGEHSALHLFLNPGDRPLDPPTFDPADCSAAELRARSPALVNDLRFETLRQGLDINSWPGGLASAAHDDETVERAIAALAATMDALIASGQRLSGWGKR